MDNKNTQPISKMNANEILKKYEFMNPKSDIDIYYEYINGERIGFLKLVFTDWKGKRDIKNYYILNTIDDDETIYAFFTYKKEIYSNLSYFMCNCEKRHFETCHTKNFSCGEKCIVVCLTTKGRLIAACTKECNGSTINKIMFFSAKKQNHFDNIDMDEIKYDSISLDYLIPKDVLDSYVAIGNVSKFTTDEIINAGIEKYVFLDSLINIKDQHKIIEKNSEK